MEHPARIVLFALEYAASRELRDLLAAPDHDVLAVRSVEEAAGLWLGGAPDLVVLDAPAPALCLRRLERRLGEDLLGWRQPALLVLPPGAGRSAVYSDAMLASCLPRPLHREELAARVRLLLRLGRALRAIGSSHERSPDSPTPASPSPDDAPLLALVGVRDTTDEAHSGRVAHLSRRLAEILGLPPELRDATDRAGRWHDLGKLALRPQLLRKPARFTEAERALVREHAPLGADLVLRLFGDETAAAAVRRHHERADGSGYLGLLGAEAPLPARLVALAEYYDAMISRQVFRRATPPEEVLEALRAQRDRWDAAALAALEEFATGEHSWAGATS